MPYKIAFLKEGDPSDASYEEIQEAITNSKYSHIYESQEIDDIIGDPYEW